MIQIHRRVTRTLAKGDEQPPRELFWSYEDRWG